MSKWQRPAGARGSEERTSEGDSTAVRNEAKHRRTISMSESAELFEILTDRFPVLPAA